MPKSRLFTSALLFTITFAACSSVSESPTDSTGPTEAQFCELYATRICAFYSPCCTQIDSPLDESACLALAKRECEGMPSYAREKGLTYDANAAADCLGRIDAGVDSCLVTNESAHKLGRDICRRDVYRGSAPLGGICERDEDCARHPDGRTECRFQENDDKVGGKLLCALPTASKEGGPCLVRNEHHRLFLCEEGLTCDPSHKCVPPLPEGAACANRGERPECAEPNSCRNGVCSAPLAEGESCSTPNDCASSRCDGTCRPRIGLGEACNPGEWPNGGCPEGFCDKGDAICKALLKVGEACGDDFMLCESQRCEGGRCVPANYVATKACGYTGADKMPGEAP